MSLKLPDMRPLNVKTILIVLVVMLHSLSTMSQDKISVDALKAGRGKLFDEGNFAMFIHWGLYSQLGGVWNDTTYYGIGEWIMNPRMAGIPVDEYMETAKTFNPVDFIWFDTPGSMPKGFVLELAAMVRELQPKAMLCSRIGHGMGDYASKGDMEVPPKNIPGLWETCDTNNDSWSYAWYDNNFKNPREILHRLVSTVGRGGSYLFNVGPDGKGNIPKIGREFLLQTGAWIKKYPQVVYKAGSSPWGHALPWGDVTTHGNSLFLSVFDWPQDGKLYLPGLNSKIRSVRLLGSESREITFDQSNAWTVFTLPFVPADSPASVIEVTLDVEAENANADGTLGIYPNIESELLVEFSEVFSAEKMEVKWMEKFGEWKHVNQISKWEENSKAEWTVEVFEPGYYYLDLNYKGEGRLVC